MVSGREVRTSVYIHTYKDRKRLVPAGRRKAFQLKRVETVLMWIGAPGTNSAPASGRQWSTGFAAARAVGG